MKKVSVIIPVYKDGNVENIAEKILLDPYPNKEIVICASQPSPSLQEKLSRLERKGVRIFVYKERKGKVREVNEVVSKLRDTDILVFIDADVEVKQIDIKKIIRYCERYDLVEFYKEVKGTCFLGKITRAEFIGYYACYQYISSKIRKSVFINGGGFAIRKDLWDKLGGYERLIIEDVDLAIRVYANGGSYHLAEDIILEVYPICSLKKWIDQRKRWIAGFIEVFLKRHREIVGYFIRYPIVLLFYITIVNPAISVFLLLSILFPQATLHKIGTNILINLASKISPILLFVIPVDFIIKIIYTILFIVLTNFLIVVFYEAFCYKIRKTLINPLWIFLYSTFYSPTFLAIGLGTLIYYLIFERFPHFNWKV